MAPEVLAPHAPPPVEDRAAATLERNLAAMGERNADLVEKIRAAKSAAGLVFADTPQDVPAATLDGTALCSRHRPLDEARRLIADIDLIDHAVIVVLGFGLGYHVRLLAERLSKTGVIIVFEPDVPLLRAAMERIDHSPWLRDSLVAWVTDPADRGALGRKLEGAEAIIAQGVQVLEHPASRARLGAAGRQFAATFGEYVSSAKTTLMTTLVRAVDTVRNLTLNVDHYAAGPGIAELKGAAAGRLAVVISAGPSLRRNLHLLRDPAVRDRCVLIAVQTMLKPLLEAGIRPHFITALDYHEISRRFYEGLNAQDVGDITLIADPKVHPAVIDAFPGPVRCCSAAYLDKLLGPLRRDMGALPAGATVAHLAVYLARFLGCDPIALIGQDLGFTDGLYYTPGTAIHDVWAPELNPFNTIEMMEWQRIVRHRTHLRKVRDIRGRTIFTDMQMTTYLQQFERDFAQYAQEGLRIIDATEGGVAKQHTTAATLADVLRDHALHPLPALPIPGRTLDPERLDAARARLAEVRRETAVLEETSRQTVTLIRRMLEDQADSDKMRRHFARIDRHRKTVEERLATFELLNHLNQLGVFKRMKADRRLHLMRDLDPMQRQRAQLDRDLENVIWIADAAAEMLRLLDDAENVLRGEPVESRHRPPAALVAIDSIENEPHAAGPSAIAALIPIDPQRNGLGIARSLAEPFEGRPVLQATLERLGHSTQLASIILIAPDGFDVESLIDRGRIGLPVEIEVVAAAGGSPFGPEQRAIAAARMWSDTCWRGGIGGMSIYDELLCPRIMHDIMQRRSLAAAVLVGPDWPLVNVVDDGGCDAVVARHREHPEQHSLVFTQSPPGLCGCLLTTKLMGELVHRRRLSTVGSLLVYQPHAPQHDPIARDANVQIDHKVRRSLARVTFDSPRCRRRLLGAPCRSAGSTAELLAALESSCGFESGDNDLPQHVTLELCTARTSRGLLSVHREGRARRPPLTIDLARRIFSQLGEAGDVAVTLAGAGDPLLHESFDEIIRIARDCGAAGIHVRTELLADRRTIDRLLAAGVDVVSVDLHADRAATYQAMMGLDRFKDVLLNIEYLAAKRLRLTDHRGTAGFAIPWIVPRIQRRAETCEDIDSFFDRWQHILGAAVIEGPPPQDGSELPSPDALAEAVTPACVMIREARRRMTIFCDGAVPVSELDLHGRRIVGNAAQIPIRALWHELLCARKELSMNQNSAEALRTYQP